MKLFYLARIDISSEDANSRHVIEFCRHFSMLGNPVTLFLPDLGKRSSIEGVDLVYIPVLIRRSAVTYFSFYCMLFFLFPYYCIKMKPDVVYTRHQQMEWITTWLKLLRLVRLNLNSNMRAKACSRKLRAEEYLTP